jgi:hypothetical protein
MASPRTIPQMRCPGCGASFAQSDGPTHPYIGASAGCWTVYGDILAKEYGEYGYPDVHRLTVDTYAVQHPGVPSPQSIQSVSIHLIGLHLVLERKLGAKAVTAALRKSVTNAPHFVWLDPPARPGELTVLDVKDAASLDAHIARVEDWARDVWQAWSSHHDTIRALAAFS